MSYDIRNEPACLKNRNKVNESHNLEKQFFLRKFDELFELLSCLFTCTMETIVA